MQVDAKRQHDDERDESDFAGRWWHTREDGRVQCDLCPRFCRLNDGQRAFCFVRQRVGEDIVLTTQLDPALGPIELPQRRDVVEDPKPATMRGDDDIVAFNN